MIYLIPEFYFLPLLNAMIMESSKPAIILLLFLLIPYNGFLLFIGRHANSLLKILLLSAHSQPYAHIVEFTYSRVFSTLFSIVRA